MLETGKRPNQRRASVVYEGLADRRRDKEVTTWNRIAFVAAILLLSRGIARIACAGGGEQQVCDVDAEMMMKASKTTR